MLILRLFTMLPLLGISLIAYAGISMMNGDMPVWLGEAAHTITNLPSADGAGLVLSNGDMFTLIGLFLLAMEVIKATNTKGWSLGNHGLSMLVFVVALFLFLTADGYATATFLMLTTMTLVDVLVGMLVTIVTARRDIGLGGFDAG